MTDLQALGGINVVEFGGGVAGAYCSRLLVDCGATVVSYPSSDGDPLRFRREASGNGETEGLLFSYLNAGKTLKEPVDADERARACIDADIIIIGEDFKIDAMAMDATGVVVDLAWFANSGPYRDWVGSDMIIQALTGMMFLNGHEDGPPLFMGDCQATFIGGMTAYVAAIAGLLGTSGKDFRHFEVSIFEANVMLSELQLAYAQSSGEASHRSGVNRYKPNSPIGIYKCRDGWLGISALTPQQWQGLCEMLGLEEFADDPDFDAGEKRHERADRLDAAISRALKARNAEQWAQEGRRLKIPTVVVPNAEGLLSHQIFEERKSFAGFHLDGRNFRVPRTPFSLSKTPTRIKLDEISPTSSYPENPANPVKTSSPLPLKGVRIADFSMGWAGPLATRIMADLGAEILKIEAGRYPDWWRAVDWAPEAISAKQYEKATHFAALNRGKQGVSIDLTTDTGRQLALDVAAKSDIVIENQAANVMKRLGLGYDAIANAKPDIVMMSMSAFGIGNSWSDTRAYGSTLEQGSGLPSFTGWPNDPPTMAHLAYGDAVSGLYGCGALLTALVHKRRSGEGQFINLSMVECMLQFTIPGLLLQQATGQEPPRRGNSHGALSPHGCFAATGNDNWVAIAITCDEAFENLAGMLGCEDWITDKSYTGLDGRIRHNADIETALADWVAARDCHLAASELQSIGVAAAPVVRVEEVTDDKHLNEVGFFKDTNRAISGPQRLCGLAIREKNTRFHATSSAPFLGADTFEVLAEYAGVSEEDYATLLETGVVTRSPTVLRVGAKPALVFENNSPAD